MTDRKFTPPTEFHADLPQALPKKQVHWANDYGYGFGFLHATREEADESAYCVRIAVIRREWVEGQPPQYFVEEV